MKYLKYFESFKKIDLFTLKSKERLSKIDRIKTKLKRDWSENYKIIQSATFLLGTDKHNVTDAKSLVEAITEKFLTEDAKN
jgi:hypothetical protein